LRHLVERSDAFLRDAGRLDDRQPDKPVLPSVVASSRPKKWGVYLTLTWGAFVALIAFLVVVMPPR
jgi:hypothetical protein